MNDSLRSDEPVLRRVAELWLQPVLPLLPPPELPRVLQALPIRSCRTLLPILLKALFTLIYINPSFLTVWISGLLASSAFFDRLFDEEAINGISEKSGVWIV